MPGAGLEVRLQPLLEGLPPPVNEGFRCGHRAAEHPADFFVAQFVLAAEQDGEALVVRQRGQGLVDLLLQLAVQQALRRRGCFLVLELVQRLVFLLRMRRVHRIDRMPRAAADFVQAEVPRNGE